MFKKPVFLFKLGKLLSIRYCRYVYEYMHLQTSSYECQLLFTKYNYVYVMDIEFNGLV